MGVSGGSAIVFADAGERAGLELSNLALHTQERLARVVPSLGVITNPIDLIAGFFTPANAAKLEEAVRATLEDSGTAALCVNLATTGQAGSVVAAEVLAAVVRDMDKPVVVFSAAPAGSLDAALAKFAAAGIPVLPSPSRAATALATLLRYRTARHRIGAEAPGAALGSGLDESLRQAAGAGRALSEAQSKAVLQRAGLPITQDMLVQGPGDVDFGRLHPPLVVKVVSPDIPHKTEVGGVRLGVTTETELKAAVAEVIANARAKVPDARIDGALVSEMVQGGFELIAGVVNDPAFGPLVVVGAGGIYTEVLQDSSSRLAPFGKEVAYEMLTELRCGRILQGARGGPALDVDAVAECLAALSRFAWDNRDCIAEIDINPLFVLPNRAVIADALIVPRKPLAAPPGEAGMMRPQAEQRAGDPARANALEAASASGAGCA
jgi:acetyltransferase